MPLTEALFWLAVSAVAYAYIGYPCAIYALSFWFPSAVHKKPFTPTMTILIAAYNEHAQIGTKIENCLALAYPPDRLDVIVVSDGSTDNTAGIVTEYARRFPTRVSLISLPTRGGKANALNVGAGRARGEILFLADVRQRFDPKAAEALAANFADSSIGAVTGELLWIEEGNAERLQGLGLYWRYEKALRRAETRFGSTVVYTGAVSAVRRSLFPILPKETLVDDLVVPLRIMAQGFRVVFEPNARAVDWVSRIPWHEFSRKVRTLAGLFQTLVNFRTHVGSLGIRAWWQLISHKVLRLLVPYALLITFVSSLFLWGPFYRFALVAQVSAYGLGLIGLLSPKAINKIRIISVPSTFLMLNLAAIIAPVRYLTGQSLDLWLRGPTQDLRHA